MIYPLKKKGLMPSECFPEFPSAKKQPKLRWLTVAMRTRSQTEPHELAKVRILQILDEWGKPKHKPPITDGYLPAISGKHGDAAI